MKVFVVILFNLISFFKISCQSAGEIWCSLPIRYQSLSNYVDQGEYTTFFYGEYSGILNSTYYLAIDSNQNVYHNIYQHKEIGSWGYEYQKASDQKEGTLTREYDRHESVPRSLAMASASLVGVGCTMLDMVARQIDGLICRRETLQYTKEKVALKSVYKMDPRSNVAYFESCFKAWNKN
jgi:hypothetical protein